MRRSVLPLASALSFVFLVSCAANDKLSASITNSSSDDGDAFLVSEIPQNFYFQDKNFVRDKNAILSNDDITDFLGYFINQEDLEKWQENDQLDNIVYVIDINNSIYNYDLDGNLTNRFELFLTTSEKTIALKADGDYLAYVSSVYEE